MITYPNKWNVLIVDDDAFIHDNLELNLRGMSHADKEVEFIHAYNAAEAKQIIQKGPKIAVVILDVMMETDDAGLNFVQFVRDEIENTDVRILLHTGQPGIAPKREVSERYMIDGYLDKNTLDNDDCYVAVRLAIKSYEEKLNSNKAGTKDDVTLLTKIAETYVWLLEDVEFKKGYEEVSEKINTIQHLSSEILASYPLEDMKKGLPVGTTKSERLSQDEYATLVQIQNIKIVLAHTSMEAYKSEKMSIYDALAQAATKFSEIKILPEASKEALSAFLKIY